MIIGKTNILHKIVKNDDVFGLVLSHLSTLTLPILKYTDTIHKKFRTYYNTPKNT